MPYVMSTRKILQAAAASPQLAVALSQPASVASPGPASVQLAQVNSDALGMTFEQLLQAKADAAAAAARGNTQAMADYHAANVVTSSPAYGESETVAAHVPSTNGDVHAVTKGEIRAFYVHFYNDLGQKAGMKVMVSA